MAGPTECPQEQLDIKSSRQQARSQGQDIVPQGSEQIESKQSQHRAGVPTAGTEKTGDFVKGTGGKMSRQQPNGGAQQ